MTNSNTHTHARKRTATESIAYTQWRTGEMVKCVASTYRCCQWISEASVWNEIFPKASCTCWQPKFKIFESNYSRCFDVAARMLWTPAKPI